MGTLVQDVLVCARWVSEELQARGYVTDYLPASLWELDRYVDENFRDGMPARRSRGSFSPLIDPTGRLFGFAFGAYLGEVIRLDRGGQWKADDADPNGQVSIELLLPDGTSILPVLRWAQRMVRGPADSVAAYARDLGVNVGAQPQRQPRTESGLRHRREKRRLFKRLPS
jgi:hypothetical protein